MISSRRGAPGRLGALYGRLPATQIGIGYYESVGEGATVTPPDPHVTSPQVVSAPEPASDVVALTTEQKAARSALEVMAIFGAGCAAVWAGFQLTRALRRQTA